MPRTLTLAALLVHAAALAAAPPVTAVAYRPGGSLLAAGTRGEIVLIDAAGEVVGTLSGQTERVTALAFSPDGKRLAAASGLPGKSGELRLYDLPAGNALPGPPRLIAAHADVVYGLAFSPDGSLVGSAGYDRLVKLWDAATGKEVRTLKDHSDTVYGLAFHPGGKLLATAAADRAVKVWDVASGRRLYSLGDATDWLYAVAWSPDGKHLAAGGVDKSVRVWAADADGGRLVGTAFAHEAPLVRLAYAADGATLYSLGEDRVVKAWDAARLAEKAVLPPQTDSVLSLALRPDGRQLALGRFDGALVLLDAATGKPQGQPLPAKPKPPQATKLVPAAGPAGAILRVTVSGTHLAAVTGGTLDLPGATVKVDPASRTAASVVVELTLPKAAAPAEAKLVLESPAGKTAPLTFTVDRFPLVVERGGNEAASGGQTVTLPATVAGRFERAGDADYVRFTAPAGTQVGAQVTLPAGSKLDPVVTITDAAGDVLTEGGSAVGLTCPSAGTYAVGVRDRDYRGGADFAYRLHVGPVPVVTAVFPLGLARGTTAEVRVEGVNLGGPRTVRVSAPADAAPGTRLPIAVATDHGPALAAPQVVVGEFPESTDAAALLPVPGTGNGVVAKPGAAPEWRFAAKKGRPLVIEAHARRLGSPLDPAVEILDAAGRPLPRAVLRCVAKTATIFRDSDSVSPAIRIEAWNELDANDYVYLGTELMRIRELPRNPDADCTFVSVEGQRRGYLGTTPTHHANGTPIYKVTIHPPGSTFPPNGMPVFTLFHRNDDAGAGFDKDSRLTFDPPADGEYRVRVTDSRGTGGPGHAYRLTVRPPRPDFALRISPNAPKVNQGGAVPLTVTASRTDEFEGPIELRFENVPPGFRVPGTRLEEGELTTVVALAADASAATPKDGPPLKVVGRATIAGKEVVREAVLGRPQAVPAGDLATHTDVSDLTIRPGGRVKLTVRVDRRSGFASRIPLDVRGLPHGVRVIDIGLNGILVLPGQTERTVTIYADPWVPPTVHPFVVLSRVEGKPGEFAAPSVTLKVEKP
jgi:hypothetical protein